MWYEYVCMWRGAGGGYTLSDNMVVGPPNLGNGVGRARGGWRGLPPLGYATGISSLQGIVYQDKAVIWTLE